MPVAGGLCHPECTSGREHLLTFSRYGGPMLRVLTLATLFPDATRPNFGVFVERQTLRLAAPARGDRRLLAPVGLPAWPLAAHPRYLAPAALTRHAMWKGLATPPPPLLTVPGTGGHG